MCLFLFFFFNDTAPTEISTLPLHDALPISRLAPDPLGAVELVVPTLVVEPPLNPQPLVEQVDPGDIDRLPRSEEHTSELQSRLHLVCRLLLEKKKTQHTHTARYQHTSDLIH